MRYILAVMAILICRGAAVAQSTNGCGSGWNVWLVPDSIPLADCSFGGSCDRHDVCYGHCDGQTIGACAYLRCKNGGDLHGSDQCKTDMSLLTSQVDAAKRRVGCDAKFYADLRAANLGKMVCAALAIVYRDAVKEWGDAAFSGAGGMPIPPAWKQPQQDYNAAIRDFFREGSAAQFDAFVRSNDAHRPNVLLSRPLRFDAEAGLVNLGQ